MSFLDETLIFEEKTSFQKMKESLSKELMHCIPIEEKEIEGLLERPRRKEYGHFSLPVFSFSKKLKKDPASLAMEWKNSILEKKIVDLENVEIVSGFINFYLTKSFLRSQLESLSKKNDLAQFQPKTKKHFTVDFASPNVAKHMNIGHLRATVIGQALVNLIKQCGHKVTSINHIGDWGTQFGKLIKAYQMWKGEYDFETKPLDTLVKLYVRFHKEAEEDDSLNLEAKKIFEQLESGNESLIKIWKSFIEISIKDYKKYWTMLNIEHDLLLGESFYVPFFENLKMRLKKVGILEKSEGAEVVFIDDSIPPCLISKDDGSSTYASRDLSSAIYRIEDLKADKNIYVTGSDQNLHFKQIFQTLDKMDKIYSNAFSHISFGIYRFKGKKKLSTRKGHVIYLQDVLNESIEKVTKIIEERDLPIEDKHEIAKKVGIGAIIFNDLMNDRVKDVDFDWNRILDFQGRTGPFVQYTYVRTLSLIKKYAKSIPTTFKYDFKQEEEDLVWLILYFEESIFQSFKNLKPHILANYLLDLSKEFNRFYSSHKILNTEREEEIMVLVQTIERILKTGLKILNVPLPKSM